MSFASLGLAPEDLEVLSTAEAAAVERRIEFLRQANAPERRGKQLLQYGPGQTIQLWRAGRGFGKTWTLSHATWWEAWRVPGIICHYLAPTLSDVEGTIFGGPAGLRGVIPTECLYGHSWEKAHNGSLHFVRLSNNSIIRGFATTEQGNRLRGPQCHFLAGDELAAWDKPPGNAEKAFDNAMLGCRLKYPDGTPARAAFGTTPTPISFLKRLEKRKDVKVVVGTSYENLSNLSESYRNTLLSKAGTLIGRQEIMAEYIDEANDLSIFKRKWFRLWPADRKLPEFLFVLEVYDTAFSEEDYSAREQKTDPTASLVLGVFNTHAVFNEQERRKLGIRAKHAVLLCDSWSERLGFPELLDKARAQHRMRWGPPGKGKASDLVLIEQKASGISLRQALIQYGVPTWPYNPGRENKTMRAHSVSPIVQQQTMWIPESGIEARKGLPRDWVEPFLDQVCAFAGPDSTEHDDYVDCLTSGLSYLRDKGMLIATPEQQYLDYEERREAERDEAERIAVRTRPKRGNPYG